MTEDYCKLIGLKIHYVKQGEGMPLLILAGWGTTIPVYQGLIDDLSDTNTVYCLEMPGCGSSDEPDKPLTSDDYAKLVKEFIKKQKITELNFFGHSNGGRTVIKILTGKNPDFKVNKVILTGCAGLVQKKSAGAQIKTKIFKAGKKVLGKLSSGLEEKIKQHVGSDDYRAATPVMRQTLVNLVNEDLREELPKIKQPTLLLWGENDDQTPLADGKLMEELIPDAGLVAFPNSTHFAFLENRARFKTIIKTFLEG
jgi:pimeloyl-ACP methyl ester carboxylesterase